MKRLLLTALLLAAPTATAQTSVTAIPATPPSSVGTPTPNAMAVTLRLTAQPGTTTQLSGSVKSQITLEDVQVSGPGGQPASAAEVARLRDDIQQGLSSGAAAAPSIKTFYRVQDRAADGTVTLLTTAVTSVPGQPPISIRLVQTVTPDGQTRVTRVESDNPAIQAALQALPPAALQAQANQGGDLTSLYGQTFTLGQPQTRTTTLDTQALLSGMLGALAKSMGAGEALANVKATPLTVRTTTTYRGPNAAGQLVFEVSSSAGTWTIDLGDPNNKTAPLRMKLELLDLTQSGQLRYRPDGLPAAQDLTQTLRMRLTMTQPGGSRMQLLLRLDQSVQAR